MRLSRMLRKPELPADESVSARSIVLWSVVALAIVAGIAMYFAYEPSVVPLVG